MEPKGEKFRKYLIAIIGLWVICMASGVGGNFLSREALASADPTASFQSEAKDGTAQIENQTIENSIDTSEQSKNQIKRGTFSTKLDSKNYTSIGTSFLAGENQQAIVFASIEHLTNFEQVGENPNQISFERTGQDPFLIKEKSFKLAKIGSGTDQVILIRIPNSPSRMRHIKPQDVPPVTTEDDNNNTTAFYYGFPTASMDSQGNPVGRWKQVQIDSSDKTAVTGSGEAAEGVSGSALVKKLNHQLFVSAVMKTTNFFPRLKVSNFIPSLQRENRVEAVKIPPNFQAEVNRLLVNQ